MKFVPGDSGQFVFMSVSFHFIIFCAFSLFGEIEAGKKCPGKCVSNASDCKSKGGKVVGYCTNDMACCEYSQIKHGSDSSDTHSHGKVGTCGTIKSNMTTATFKSPDYPEHNTGDLTCTFEFGLRHDATGILVDFVDVRMDGKSFVKDSTCESDMFIFKGFHDFTPPIQCGNLTNYVAVIDLGTNRTRNMNTFKIIAHMSSTKYRWLIKVSQVVSKSGGGGYQDDSSDSWRRPATTSTTTYRPKKYYKERENEDETQDEEDLSPLIDTDKNDEEVIDRALLNARFGGDPRHNRIVNVPMFGSTGLEETPFIVNGDETNVTRTPWQASLRITVTPKVKKLLKLKECALKEGRHFCGGTIISSNAILSAAHCLHHGIKRITWEQLHHVKVVLGDNNLCDENTNGVQEFRVKKVYFHYGYDMRLIMHDMIVIQLDKDIRFTDKVKKIKMADTGMKFEHEEALASGWGLTNLTIGHKAKTPEQLQYADDFLIGNLSECTKDQIRMYMHAEPEIVLKYPKYENVFNSLLCTYVGDASVPRVVGQGDSGGPIVRFSNRHHGSSRKHGEGEPTLIGVISYMIKDHHVDEYGHHADAHAHNVSNYVNFYQSVAFYRKWIDLVLHNFKE